MGDERDEEPIECQHCREMRLPLRFHEKCHQTSVKQWAYEQATRFKVGSHSAKDIIAEAEDIMNWIDQ